MIELNYPIDAVRRVATIPHISWHYKVLKRGFDFSLAAICLALLWPVILLSWLIARHDTGAGGFFTQTRIGQYGRHFKIVRLRTMRPAKGSTITTANDPHISKYGSFFRRHKIDELPQLWNVLMGEMSFVGPRPDVPGYMDVLKGADKVLLLMKPGITGPATLKYHDAESVLALQADPKHYNDDVIWPDKVRINLKYQKNWSLRCDISYIIQTLLK